ncbi:MAG: carboxypeptidase regulatory-like domain-containing protein, partial [Calditrichaeota bacterium]|nr:carboxypeptidase regulatory-like domain-containing protein [Calditrichota bacterium]
SISGTGTPVALSDDSFAAVAVPFAFNFYGATFNDIAVCSNGYVTAGSVNGSSSLGNGAIPGSGTPNNAVYGIWDDLNPGAGGAVYSEYRAGTGEFVVEYSNVPYFGDANTVDFQIILRDPAVWPTISGDAQWLVHYNSGTRGSSTTGIENLAGDDAVEYVVDLNYDVHSSEIAAGLSLLITTMTGDTGTLEGTITEAGSGDPIVGATVTAGASSVMTDGSGFYSMVLGVGTYDVDASAFGYVANSVTNVNVTVDATTTVDIALTAMPTAILSGTVFDQNSVPFDGATVTVLGSPYAPVVTSGGGLYSIEVLDNTSWSVQAVGGGEGSQTLPVTMSGNTVLNFTLPGDPMFSPSDPDNYGYRIFDSNDGTGAPVYSWNSISGIGTQLTLTDDSYSEQTTPFSYNFYGNTFNTVSVCSNGYIVPGTGYTIYSNVEIPSVGTPNGAVYGTWDDMNPSAGGTVWVMYSAAHGGYVIEFDGVFFYGTTTPMYMQFVILDPSLFPTPTGDAAFLIHYNTGDRLSSTIGIEDGTGTDGVQYGFNGVYDITSSPIAGGSISLLITTNPFGMESGEDTFAPNIAHTGLGNTSNTAGPYTVNANITDASGIASATLEYRVNGGAWNQVAMSPARVAYTGDIPGPRSYGDVIDYHITAVDASDNGNSATTPDYTFNVVDYGPLFCDDFETNDLAGWTVETYDPLGSSWTTEDYGDPQF